MPVWSFVAVLMGAGIGLGCGVRGDVGSGGHRAISSGDVFAYVRLPTAPWVLASMLGVYVSIRLIVDGDYGVLIP